MPAEEAGDNGRWVQMPGTGADNRKFKEKRNNALEELAELHIAAVIAGTFVEDIASATATMKLVCLQTKSKRDHIKVL